MPALVVDDELVCFFNTPCRHPSPIRPFSHRDLRGQDTDWTCIHLLPCHPTQPGLSPAIHTRQELSPHLPQLTPSQHNRAGTPSHSLSPLHNIHPSQVDPLLFPRQLPNNPSLSRWCKWRPHQHSPAAQLQVRCSLPASSANLGRAHPGRRSGMAPVPESGMQ